MNAPNRLRGGREFAWLLIFHLYSHSLAATRPAWPPPWHRVCSRIAEKLGSVFAYDSMTIHRACLLCTRTVQDVASEPPLLGHLHQADCSRTKVRGGCWRWPRSPAGPPSRRVSQAEKHNRSRAHLTRVGAMHGWSLASHTGRIGPSRLSQSIDPPSAHDRPRRPGGARRLAPPAGARIEEGRIDTCQPGLRGGGGGGPAGPHGRGLARAVPDDDTWEPRTVAQEGP